jgi:hypothetical protein
MAVVTGKSGSLYDGSTAVGNLDSWSFDASMDTEETTAFQAGAKTHAAVIYGASGSMSGKYNKADGGQGGLYAKFIAGTEIVAKLIVSGTANGSGSGYTGSIILQKFHVGAKVGALVEFSSDFVVTGALTASDTL